MEKWVKDERWQAFPKISAGGLNEMADTTKRLAIVVTDENERSNEHHMRWVILCQNFIWRDVPVYIDGCLQQLLFRVIVTFQVTIMFGLCFYDSHFEFCWFILCLIDWNFAYGIFGSFSELEF